MLFFHDLGCWVSHRYLAPSLKVVVALDVGLWSLSHLLIVDHLWCPLQGLPGGGDAKLRGEGQGQRHILVFEDAVDHGVYALFMT